jgi:hypothetical protein
MSHSTQKCYKSYSVQYTLHVIQLAIMLLHLYGSVHDELYRYVMHFHSFLARVLSLYAWDTL